MIVVLIKAVLVICSCFFAWLAANELTSSASLSPKPEMATASGLRSLAKAAIAIWALLAVMTLGV